MSARRLFFPTRVVSGKAKASRVLVVGINYAPENIGTGKYTSEMCSWLAARGHDVRVVTAPPYYPAWKVWPGHARFWWRCEHIEGVELIRCPLWVPKHPRGLTRLLHLASFAFSSAIALAWSLAWRAQRVVVVAPTMAAAPAGWLFARASRARCWLHIQDFELDAALDMGIIDAGVMKRTASRVERWLLRRFDVVSTISPKMIERLQMKGVDSARQVLFPNWADIEGIEPLQKRSAYRVELGIPDDAIVALYSGNMGLKQGLELVGEAARNLQADRDLYFVFGGEGPMRAELEKACQNLPNVRFLGLQPLDRLNEWLGLADIHLLPQRADVADLVMPSKLTGMLASGRPVLATALPGTGVASVVDGCGIATTPGDIDEFLAALRKLAEDADLRTAYGHAARARAIDTMARQVVLERFEKALVQTMPGKADPITTPEA